VFQEFATLDLISGGCAEIVAGRGSSIESFSLFGFDLHKQYSLFAQKLDLFPKIRDNTRIHWSGKYRAPLTGQAVCPGPLQDPLPIWVGVGGTSMCGSRDYRHDRVKPYTNTLSAKAR
jgi:alkanesulfonate monooxygenase SsuD/methylene tetrahydromethanopterin reductase-like flavin-dependent oxidoreductase (luciferase family)